MWRHRFLILVLVVLTSCGTEEPDANLAFADPAPGEETPDGTKTTTSPAADMDQTPTAEASTTSAVPASPTSSSRSDDVAATDAPLSPSTTAAVRVASNPDFGGDLRDAVLISIQPDCRDHTESNGGDYGSSGVADASNGGALADSHVHLDLVIASEWDPETFDYASVTRTDDPAIATHCRMTSNMIPNHDFGIAATGPNGGGWINPIDHHDSEITYIPVAPVKTKTAEDTPRRPPIFDFDGILLNGVGIAMDSGFCYNPGVTTGPRSRQSNSAGNSSGCGPQNAWFELPAYNIWDPEEPQMAAVFDPYFAHGFVGTYHYHAITHPLQEDADQRQPPSNGEGSPVIGFAPDGFPIYGHWFRDANGTVVKAESGYEVKVGNSREPIDGARHGTPPTPWDIANNPGAFESDFGLELGRYEDDWFFAGSGNLDECNGAFNADGNYGYYVTDAYPFAPPCIFGVRDQSFGKSSPTLG